VESEAKWYVVHTYSGYENKVKTNLEKRVESMEMKEKIFQVLVPMEDEVEIKDGKEKRVKRKVFPGYVLVQMIMSDDSWYVVRNTPGVTGFVGSGTKPIPLQSHEVEAILGAQAAQEVRLKSAFEVGQPVRVVTGPFKDFTGKVEEVLPERGKLRVQLSMFGRETTVELDHGQVEDL
jgi:transcriptional antiterminator NusG